MSVNHLKEFQKGIKSLAGKYHIWQVFEDWVEAAACELMQGAWQASHPVKNPEIEKQYMDIVSRYDPEEVRTVFPQLFMHLVEGLSEEPQDFLGQVFMELDLGSHWHGQFFTPYHVAKMMVQSVIQEVPDTDVITISDPACGSGCMLIAAAEVLKEKKIDPTHHMHAVAVDVDPTCFNMAYIQLSLMGISAEVVLGNSLSMEVRKTWRTFASVLTCHTMESLRARDEMKTVEMPAKETRQTMFDAWGVC